MAQSAKPQPEESVKIKRMLRAIKEDSSIDVFDNLMNRVVCEATILFQNAINISFFETGQSLPYFTFIFVFLCSDKEIHFSIQLDSSSDLPNSRREH